MNAHLGQPSHLSECIATEYYYNVSRANPSHRPHFALGLRKALVLFRRTAYVNHVPQADPRFTAINFHTKVREQQKRATTIFVSFALSLKYF